MNDAKSFINRWYWLGPSAAPQHIHCKPLAGRDPIVSGSLLAPGVVADDWGAVRLVPLFGQGKDQDIQH